MLFPLYSGLDFLEPFAIDTVGGTDGNEGSLVNFHHLVDNFIHLMLPRNDEQDLSFGLAVPTYRLQGCHSPMNIVEHRRKFIGLKGFD